MGQADQTILVFGLVFLVSGMAFKLGVVPFHMWIPDVYHGAPTAVTLFIATAPEAGGICDGHSHAGQRADRPFSGLADDADPAFGTVDGHR
jgi:hypothetical protein